MAIIFKKIGKTIFLAKEKKKWEKIMKKNIFLSRIEIKREKYLLIFRFKSVISQENLFVMKIRSMTIFLMKLVFFHYRFFIACNSHHTDANISFFGSRNIEIILINVVSRCHKFSFTEKPIMRKVNFPNFLMYF